MEEAFTKAFNLLLELEGWHSNLDNDPGGETLWGISSRWYPLEFEEISQLPREEQIEYARKFYYRHFWLAYGCNTLPTPYAIAFFCQAVNYPGKALAAKAKHPNDWQAFLFECLVYYASNPHREFFRGWVNRVLKIWRRCYELATVNT